MELFEAVGTRGALIESAGGGGRGAAEPTGAVGGGAWPVSNDIPGDPQSAVQAALDQANSAADRLIQAVAHLGAHPEGLDAATLERFVQDVQRLVNRHDRIRTRALDVVRRTREAGQANHLDDAQFTAGRTRTDGRRAHRDAGLATALGNHAPLPPAGGADAISRATSGATPGRGTGPSGPGSGAHDDSAHPTQSPTAQAWDDGLINREQALVITGALDDLPDHLSADECLTVEVGLVSKAQRLSPAQLRRAAKRALAELGLPQAEVDAHHNELVRNEENAAWEAASFWITDRGDGTMHGQFTLPVLQGRMLQKALHALTSPRRLAHKQRQQTPEATVSWKDSQIDWAHERGKALAELINHLPTDKLGSKINAILLVHTDLETLRGETDRAGVTDTGDEVSAGQVRHLAANAGIIPLVMDGASQALDLGRQRRFFTDSQRATLSASYDSCAALDCDRPFAWCEVHHDDPFHPRRGPDGQLLHPGGGPTDLANGIPLCGQHHRLTEDPRWVHTTTRDDRGKATVTFTRRHPGDPSRGGDR